MYCKRLSIAALCGTVLSSLALSGHAATLASDDFSYPDGGLVGNGGWVNQSGTAGTLLVSSGAVAVSQDSGSEDAELVFASNTSGVLTASFDITVTAPGAMTGTDFEYFANFSNDTSFNFSARVDVQTPNAGGDYTLGISTETSTGQATLPTDFSFGTVVPVSISFNFDTGIGSLTAGGNTVDGTGVSLGEVLNAFNLRQSNSSSDETISVDNLVVSHVPEPASLMLMLVGLMGMGIARRR